MKVRDALKGEITVIIDERDQDALSKQEGELGEDDNDGASIERVNVTQRVRMALTCYHPKRIYFKCRLGCDLLITTRGKKQM